MTQRPTNPPAALRTKPLSVSIFCSSIAASLSSLSRLDPLLDALNLAFSIVEEEAEGMPATVEGVDRTARVLGDTEKALLHQQMDERKRIAIAAVRFILINFVLEATSF